MKSQRTAHNNLVDSLIMGSTAHSFDELVTTLPGVWPGDALASIKRLHDKKQLSISRAMQLQSRVPNVSTAPAVPWLMPPHPLDADWRFTATTSTLLLELAAGYSGAEAVLLLGTPSLAIAADCEGVPAILVDRDSARMAQLGDHLHRVQLVEADLLDDRPSPVADAVRVVVADPPWYASYYQSFIRSAACALGVGGRLVLVVPAKATRPGVASEIAGLIRYASKAGMAVLSETVPVPRYESPPFEEAALAADGLDRLPSGWRSADVLVLVKTHDVDPGMPERAPGTDPDQVRWTEYASSHSRVRIRTIRAGHGPGPVLGSLLGGDVLPSVSRRHPLWPVADVWTTGNRIYTTSEPGRLIASLVATGDVTMSTEDDELRDAVNTIRETMAVEDAVLRQKGWR